MSVKVVDSSAVAAILFAEPEADKIAAGLESSSLVTSALLPFEVANVCLKKMHRSPRRRNELLSAFAYLQRMELETRQVELEDVLLLAEQVGLTAYDAAYLWLARDLSAELITLDSSLLHAYQSLQ
jgi:predicted nucleic acid-binding protein